TAAAGDRPGGREGDEGSRRGRGGGERLSEAVRPGRVRLYVGAYGQGGSAEAGCGRRWLLQGQDRHRAVLHAARAARIQCAVPGADRRSPAVDGNGSGGVLSFRG